VKILALDTSTLTGSAAVVVDGAVVAESTTRIRATHSEQILPLVDEVLARAGLALDAIDRIGVGVGPGSFTGVRIGVATAKGLHIATGVALVGVPSLDALASAAWGVRGCVLAALDARRGEAYAALFAVAPGERRAVMDASIGAPALLGARALALCAEGAITVVGDLSPADLAALTACDPSRFVVAPSVVASPLARFVAWEVLAGRGRLDAGELEPLYVRGSDAKLPGGREVPR
jgi:tRNA threonylcarbamoyladenosine biosynthesis protein TsaB